MTLVNYFPDFLLLSRDVLEPGATVAQRQADARTLQQQISVVLDSLRWVWAPMGWVHGLQMGWGNSSIPFHPGVWKAPREAFRTTNRFYNMLWRMWTESSCSEASDPNTCTSM